MLEYERELFDEFKRLESLCRDMFSCQHGVSEYINQMEQIPPYIKNRIPSWDRDYRTLKHLRWLRNQIAHEMTATDCDFDDVEQLKDFYRRILNGQDPLAMARKVKQNTQSCSCQKSSNNIKLKSVFYDNKREQKRTHSLSYVWFSLISLILIILIILLFVSGIKNEKRERPSLHIQDSWETMTDTMI